jgi:hypothetical protein
MSKCKPDCCSGSSGDGSGMAIIGFIVLAAAAYGIFRAIVHAAEAIMHTVIEIVEITAISVGSIAGFVLLVFVAVWLSRWRRRQIQPAGLKPRVIRLNPTVPLIVAAQGPGKPAADTAQLFAEAVTSPDMDPRFIERLLRNAMSGTDQ